MEPKQDEEDMVDEESVSKHSNQKNRRIRKSPKPARQSQDTANQEKRDSIFSSLRVVPQFGVFESEMQKQSRLQKFWLSEIDNYYKNQIGRTEKQMLSAIIEEEIPSLRDVIEQYQNVLPNQRVPFEQLFRYVELVRQCRLGSQLMIVQSQSKNFLASFRRNGELDRLAEINQEEVNLLVERHRFLTKLRQKQNEYNSRRRQTDRLSQISSEIAFLLHLMKRNKIKINNTLESIQEKISQEIPVDVNSSQNIRDQYITCLIRKNIKKALENQQIDFLNYFASLDAIQQYGVVDSDQKLIADKKEFEEYIKKKKGKKTRKNIKGVLKTACGGCLSPHYQQYNPLTYCPDCHIRYHKYCYTPYKDNLCQNCYIKKEPTIKSRVIECQFCSNRGLLSVPSKSIKEGVNIHVFCMLINGLWVFENGILEFRSMSSSNINTLNEHCSLCNSAVYTYPCGICSAKAHPLCAYLSGWNIELLEDGGLSLQCCGGVDLEGNKERRKFMLNYKKYLYKEQKDR